MKVTYIENDKDKLKLIVESKEVSDVLQVLNLFVGSKPVLIESKQELEIIEIPPVTQSLTKDKPVISSAKYTKEIKEYEHSKTLIFWKCKTCGSVSFIIDYPDTEVQCYYCNEHRELDPLHTGSYECTCGESSEFLMEDNVTEIKCRNKECSNRFVMLWDNTSDSYIGSLFKY